MKSFAVGFFIVNLSIKLSFALESFGFDPIEIDVIENQGAVPVKLGTINPPFPASKNVKCVISDFANLPSTLIVHQPNHPPQPANTLDFFLIKKNPGKLTIQYKAKSDNHCSDKTYLVHITCFKNSEMDYPPMQISSPLLTINVHNTESASMCEDPHLTQKVNGMDENGKQVTKDVCYDLFGKSGEQMELMTDNILGTSIVFELRDDYYIGKVFYSTKLGYFNFTTTKMTCTRWMDSYWGKENKFVVGESNGYPHAIVTQNKEDVLIEYNEEHRSQSIRVAKIQQGYGKSYLNVLIEKSSTVNGVFDEFHGGIFGLIANQKYEFYNSVQEFGTPTVKVNGQLVKTSLKGKRGETAGCYSMSLDDLLYPKNGELFRKSL